MMTGALVPPPPIPQQQQQPHYPSTTSQYRGQLYPRNDAASYGRSGLMYPAVNQPLPQQQQQPPPPPPPQVNHHPRINMYPTNGRLPQQQIPPPQLQSYNNMHIEQQQQLPLQPPSMMPQHPGGYATSSYNSGGYGSAASAAPQPPSMSNSVDINHGVSCE